MENVIANSCELVTSSGVLRPIDNRSRIIVRLVETAENKISVHPHHHQLYSLRFEPPSSLSAHRKLIPATRM